MRPWWFPGTREFLAISSTVIFVLAYVVPLVKSHINPQILDGLNDYQGAIILQWGLVMGYYFGTLTRKD